MNSTVIQHWQYSYLCVAFLAAVVAAVAADHLRAGDPPALSVRCAAASLAGALWPVLVVGFAQWWTVSKVVDRVRPTSVSHRPAPSVFAGAGSH